MAGLQHPTVAELAQQLSEGFAALSDEYQLLFDQHRQLETKLALAKQQCLDLFQQYAPDALSENPLPFLQLEDAGAKSDDAEADWKDQLAQDESPERRRRASQIKQAESAANLLRVQSFNEQVKIWRGPSADRDGVQQSTELPHIEKDFTTPGTPSKLGCPFASGSGRQSALITPRSSTSRMSLRGPRSKRPSFNDPIRAEICANAPVSTSGGSADGSAAVCPIRFLDQHKPEEVAQYFENHKHEIPRSHEVCIKRFQSNADSIRQLDAKYGSLVNMIQGLGVKHQPWLPKEPEDVDDEALQEGESDEKVEKWAKAVSASLADGHHDEEPDSPPRALDETRTAHFDRPLKEIRLGESPTRPWGISVPSKYAKADTASVESAPTASPPAAFKASTHGVESPQKPSKCPFNHGMPKTAQPASAAEEGRDGKLPPPSVENEEPDAASGAGETGSAQRLPISYPQMIFNGPVFIGYPLDQALSLLQQSNAGRTMQ